MTHEAAIARLEEHKATMDKFVKPTMDMNNSIVTLVKAEEMAIAALRERQKPLTFFLAPLDSYEGLKQKYLVFKAESGEQIVNCFVLRPDKDPAAITALRAYANTTDNATLAADIFNWVGREDQNQNE